MHAHTLPTVVEQRNLPIQCYCYSLLACNGKLAVSKTTTFPNIAQAARFYGISCSRGSSCILLSGVGVAQESGRRLRRSGGLVQTEVSGIRCLVETRHSDTKGRWRSQRNINKQPIDRNPLVVVEKFSKKLNEETFEAENVQIRDLPRHQIGSQAIRWHWSTLAAIAMSLGVLAAPEPSFTDSSFTFSNFARADQLGQLTKAATVLEKAAEGLSKVRFDGDVGLQVLDKAVTVVTGSTFIDPVLLDKEVDALLSGKKDIRDELRNGINSIVQNSWSTAVDVVTNFNPASLSESAGASISTVLEAGAERIAAFELSALVSLGERWLILTPLIMIPMAWEMKRLKKESENEQRESQLKFEQLSGQAELRGGKVRRELERIELRTQLMDAVSSLGKLALQPPRIQEEVGLIRRRVNDILHRLEELKPVEDPLLLIPEFASAVSTSGAGFTDALARLPTSPTIDGNWNLIYISEANDVGRQQELPQFPGIGLDNIRQKVWQMASISSSTPDNDIPAPSRLQARNTAEIRLGPLGVLQIALQGSWQNLEDGQRALVSFDSFSARPVEIFGNKMSADMPELNVSLPPPLQQSAEWGIVYVDNHVRINRGSHGQLFLFHEIE